MRMNRCSPSYNVGCHCPMAIGFWAHSNEEHNILRLLVLSHVFLLIVLPSSLSFTGKRIVKVGVYVKLHLGADI